MGPCSLTVTVESSNRTVSPPDGTTLADGRWPVFDGDGVKFASFDVIEGVVGKLRLDAEEHPELVVDEINALMGEPPKEKAAPSRVAAGVIIKIALRDSDWALQIARGKTCKYCNGHHPRFKEGRIEWFKRFVSWVDSQSVTAKLEALLSTEESTELASAGYSDKNRVQGDLDHLNRNVGEAKALLEELKNQDHAGTP